jgi:biopolymer transport protein ExbB
MRSVSALPARDNGRKSVLFLLMALAAASIWPTLGTSSLLFAQDDPAAATPPVAAAESAPPSTPAPGAADASTPPASRSFLAYIARACGWFWGPAFLLVSFILVALIMMNLLQVRRDVLLPSQFVEEFEQKLNAKDFQGAYEFARGDESFVGRVLALEHRLSYVALIGSIAPMMGLMGTVQGMISSFDKIALSAVSPKPSELADGISTALVTTLIGLLLAIPAMIFHSILKNRIQRLVLEIGMVSEGLMGRFATVGKQK